MKNKVHTFRHPHFHRKASLPYTSRQTFCLEPSQKAGIFDINFIFDKFPLRKISPHEVEGVNKSHKQTHHTVSHPVPSSLNHYDYSQIKMAPFISSNKTEPKRPITQLLFRKDIKQVSIHSRKSPSRKATSFWNKKRSTSQERQFRQEAKQRVRAKILKGDALIKIVQSPSLDLNQKIEGRHLSYGISHYSSRTSKSKNSSRTVSNGHLQHKNSREQVMTQNKPRGKNYRPWSPVGDYEVGDQGLHYFLSTHH